MHVVLVSQEDHDGNQDPPSSFVSMRRGGGGRRGPRPHRVVAPRPLRNGEK